MAVKPQQSHSFFRVSTGLVFVVVLVVALIPFGCGPAKPVAGVPPARGPGRVPAKLAKDFPSDFPIPPGSELLQARKVTDDPGGVVFIAIWRTLGKPAELLDPYQKELVSRKWQIVNVKQGDIPVMEFKRADDKTASEVRLVAREGSTMIMAKVYRR